MKIKLLLISLIELIFIPGNAQSSAYKIYKPGNYNLKGPVKSIKSIEHYGIDITDSNKMAEIYYSQEYFFNSSGFQTKEITKFDGSDATETNWLFQPDTLLFETTQYGTKYRWKYDQYGRVVEEKQFTAEDFNTWTYTFAYDSTGRLITEHHFNFDIGLLEWFSWEYDSHGNITSRKIFDRTDSLVSNKVYDYTYDEAGRIVKRIITIDNRLDDMMTWRYDSNGNVAQEDWYNSKGVILFLNYFWYDANGNTLRDLQTNVDSSHYSDHVYSYDKSNNLIDRCFFNKDSSFFSKQVMVYDSNNNCTDFREYDRENKLKEAISYSVVVDQYGNWVQSTKIRWGERVVTTREIQYY